MEENIFRLPPVRVQPVLAPLAETVDWGLQLLGVPELWRQSAGQQVRVAVLDTGIEAEHPDLTDALDDARDFTGSRHGPIDRHGHGTHVAGIVGARRNETGVAGVAPECRLLAAKVLGDDGAGGERQAARGIDWAVESGADILSLSLGSRQPSPIIYQALERAMLAGRFVVCAAGNSGPRADSVDYPARYPWTIAVAAVDRQGRVARFSSRGPEIDLAAPGADVLSTYLAGGYARLSGTSMAAPFVSGVAALVLSKHRRHGGKTPIRHQQDLVEHLRRTARDAGPPGVDPEYGWGLIDPASALAAADAPAPAPPPAAPEPAGVWVWIPDGKAQTAAP